MPHFLNKFRSPFDAATFQSAPQPHAGVRTFLICSSPTPILPPYDLAARRGRTVSALMPGCLSSI